MAVISPNFLVRKFCGKPQFPHMRKLWLSTKFPHQETKRNYDILRSAFYFKQSCFRDIYPISDHCFLSLPTKNIRKSLVFWCSQGFGKGRVGWCEIIYGNITWGSLYMSTLKITNDLKNVHFVLSITKEI